MDVSNATRRVKEYSRKVGKTFSTRREVGGALILFPEKLSRKSTLHHRKIGLSVWTRQLAEETFKEGMQKLIHRHEKRV